MKEAVAPSKVRFLQLPDRVLKALAAHGLKPDEVPEHFKGQRGPTKAVDLGTLLIAHQDLSDDLAYLITKTICEKHDVMAKAHKAWARFDPKRSGDPQETGIPLHSGARRYYEERGWLKQVDKGDDVAK